MLDARPVQVATLEEVQARFAAWRNKPHRTRRIPDELWEAAVSLCAGESVCKVSRALGLDYNALRSRWLKSKAVDSRSPFVDLAPLWSQGEVLIECVADEGAQLRIRCTGNIDPRLLDLVSGFFESRR